MNPARATRTLVSLHHVADGTWRGAFCTVVRAGHVACGPESRYQRDTHPGHELIFCLRGRGLAALGGGEHAVPAGSVVWVNCHHPHAYWPDPSDPWEHVWLRFEGPGVEAAWKQLAENGGPVVAGFDRRAVRRAFADLFRLLDRRPPDLAPRLHAAVAGLVSMVFSARTLAAGETAGPELPAGIRRALQRMHLAFHLPLRVRDLARLAGLSESHFIRSFGRHVGSSPIEWLRAERLRQARLRLVETDDPMKQIARQCGWGDQFQFSRDFRRLAGSSPTEYRRRERGRRS